MFTMSTGDVFQCFLIIYYKRSNVFIPSVHLLIVQSEGLPHLITIPFCCSIQYHARRLVNRMRRQMAVRTSGGRHDVLGS